ncbi:hypothetical protein RB195_019037 [Necator americanus]|uniref:Uncharacterized protein n=1 Tax=Necator americanus TaxID=51031 RepID=A0ABR1CDE1_NECAM
MACDPVLLLPTGTFLNETIKILDKTESPPDSYDFERGCWCIRWWTAQDPQALPGCSAIYWFPRRVVHEYAEGNDFTVDCCQFDIRSV